MKACDKAITMRDIFLDGLHADINKVTHKTKHLDHVAAVLSAHKGQAALEQLRWLPNAAAAAASKVAGFDVDAVCQKLLHHGL